jgi:hypothetical protein
LHCLRGSIYSEDVPSLADQLRSQKAHVSAAATDIEDTHARSYSCLLEELPSEGCEHTALKREAVQFARRMAESVFDLSRVSKL